MSTPTDPPVADAAGPETKPSKAGRDLGAAIGVGVGIGAVVLLSVFLYRPAFAVLVAAAVAMAVHEVATAVRAARIVVAPWPLMAGGVAMCAAAWFYELPGLALALLISFLAAVVWRMSRPVEGFVVSSAVSAFILLYLPFLAAFTVLMVHREDGALWIVTWAVAVVCNDTGGYATGVLAGRHPMAPAISPKKSWEGFAGSLVAACIGSTLMITLTLDGLWWHGVLFGLAIAMVATLGDLAESMIKRDIGIKDMSALLPGHGGLMDRMDSLLFSAPLAWMLLTLFVG